MELLESALGYTFRDRALLTQALTHASFTYKSKSQLPHNQRLEFLGDAVFQLLVAELLFRLYPQGDEGYLTKARAQLVSCKALAKIARRIRLGGFLLIGRSVEASGVRERDSTLSDAFEAIIAAAFLDGGIETARSITERLFVPELQQLESASIELNPKGLLQEKLQAINARSPSYIILEESGPAHAKSFISEVTWNGLTLGRGIGRTKQSAEVEAAKAALDSEFLNRLGRDYTATKIPTKSCEQSAQNSPQL